MTGRHPLAGHPGMREVRVPVATVWTAPDAPRDVDADAVTDRTDVAAWAASQDAQARLGLHGRTLTQLLLGEPALVVEERDGWSRVAALWQASSADEHGYPGWVRTAHLGRPVERIAGPTAFVTARTSVCRRDDEVELALSLGTALWVEASDDATVTVLLPDGRRGTLARADVRLSDKSRRPTLDGGELLAVAGTFLGVRYLWGGTSAWGLDCSGLVHLVLRSRGVLLPRDAFDMADCPDVEPVPLDAVQPGDLYFFARPGERVYHVGFASRPVGADGVRWMLHAPEGGGLIEDAPLAPHRVATLVSAGRVRPDLSARGDDQAR
jgi:cell wall-associated NlpC family hydrolase